MESSELYGELYNCRYFAIIMREAQSADGLCVEAVCGDVERTVVRPVDQETA